MSERGLLRVMLKENVNSTDGAKIEQILSESLASPE